MGCWHGVTVSAPATCHPVLAPPLALAPAAVMCANSCCLASHCYEQQYKQEKHHLYNTPWCTKLLGLLLEEANLIKYVFYSTQPSISDLKINCVTLFKTLIFKVWLIFETFQTGLVAHTVFGITSRLSYYLSNTF